LFFHNGAQPGGVLSAPGAISDETAKRLKEHWDTNFAGKNSGKVAVLGDGLKYEAMKAKAIDSQLIEQLKWSAEVVCSTYHVPPYKIGVGTMPTYNNVQALNIEYYSQCLQVLIEAAELCLDEGLGMGENIGTEFDVDNLLRMDTTALINAEKDAVGAGIKSPKEARRRLDLKLVAGGNSPYLQQQNYSLEALARRDAQEDPFGTAPARVPEPPANDNAMEAEARAALVEIYKGLRRCSMEKPSAKRSSASSRTSSARSLLRSCPAWMPLRTASMSFQHPRTARTQTLTRSARSSWRRSKG
jgi:phage portal protein BeeE